MERAHIISLAASLLLATETLLSPSPANAARSLAEGETEVWGSMVAKNNRLEARVLCLNEKQRTDFYIESPTVVFVDGKRLEYPRNLVTVTGSSESGVSILGGFFVDNTDVTTGEITGTISESIKQSGLATFLDPEKFTYNRGSQIVAIDGNLSESNIRAGLTHSCYSPKARD